MWASIEREMDSNEKGRDEPARPAAHRWFSTQTLLPIAATLIIGVAIGRISAGTTPAVAPDSASSPVAGRVDSVAIQGPYQLTTSRYLGQTVALLAALPAEVRSGRAGEPYLGRAHDLLLTTRLLLDSPAAADPRFRTLLEDLELVLAQVVRLQSVQSPGELDLIREALEQRDVLPRLRTAAADMSADD
jgi:hypothetical protein